jgi:hypothetical protein
MISIIQHPVEWISLVVLSAAWTAMLVQIIKHREIWKTKKDFSFDELDKLLESQDYKFEVSKYLHKYKSDRRWYEDRIARQTAVLALVTLCLLADIVWLIILFNR